MNTGSVSLYIAILLLMSCDPSAVESSPSDAAHGTHGTVQDPEPTAAEGVAGVALDHGNRWQANAETNSGIATMTGLLEGYPGNGIAAADLKDTLEAEFALIFERCTMTGEAHEQLHNYLKPLPSMLRDLPTDAPQDGHEAILGHLRKYGTYFE